MDVAKAGNYALEAGMRRIRVVENCVTGGVS